MLKAVGEGFARRIGEHIADTIWVAVIIGAPVLAWFTAPISYSLALSRWQITAFVAVVLALLATTAWLTRRVTRHFDSSCTFVPVDEVQRNILRIMWAAPNGIHFSQLQSLLGEHPNYTRLACEHLNKRSFISYNTYTPETVVLLHDGREYAAANKLTDATEIFQRAANRTSGAKN